MPREGESRPTFLALAIPGGSLAKQRFKLAFYINFRLVRGVLSDGRRKTHD